MGIKAVLNNSRRKVGKVYAVVSGQRKKVTKVYAVVGGLRKLVWNAISFIGEAAYYSRSGFSSSYDTAGYGTLTSRNSYTIYTNNASTRASVTIRITGLENKSHFIEGIVDGVDFPENPPSNKAIKVGCGSSSSPSLTTVSNGTNEYFSFTASGATLYLKFEIPTGRYNSAGDWYDYTYVYFDNICIDGIPVDLYFCDTWSQS